MRGIRLHWLFLFAIIPALGVLMAFAVLTYQQDAAETEQETLKLAHTLSQAVDREFLAAEHLLVVFAQTMADPTSRDGPRAIDRAAREILRQTSVGDVIALTDESGQMIVNTYVPFGQALPRTQHLDELRQLFAGGQTQVSNLLTGTLTRRRLIAINVPVRRGGKVAYKLNVALLSDRIGEILQAQTLPVGWIAAVCDRNGIIAARTRDPDKFVGQKVAPALFDRLGGQREGTLVAPSLEGVQSTAAYSTSDSSGYTVVVGAPTALTLAGLNRKLQYVGAAIGLVTVGSLLLVAYFNRQIQNALSGLSQRIEAATADRSAATSPLGGPVEIARLGGQFEKMLAFRRQLESALRDERARLYGILETLPVYVLVLTADYRVEFANRVFRERFGDDCGRRCYEFLFGRKTPCEFCHTYAVMHGEPTHEWEWTGPDGLRYAVFDSRITGADGQARILEMGIDVTRQRLAESEQKRLNRSLRLLSRCNGAVVHARQEAALLEAVCELIVHIGGYRMAWIGMAQNDGVRKVLPVAHSGDDDGYLDAIQVTWDDGPYGSGPTGAAIRTGTTQVNQNWAMHSQIDSWREAALQRGYQSSIALPLVHEGRAFAALSIYSHEADAFFPQEVQLLEELAENISHGVAALRSEAARQRSDDELRQSRQSLRELSAYQVGLVEEERRHIAREVHDELGQMLTALKMSAALLLMRCSNDADQRRAIADMQQMVDRTIQVVRHVARNLRPAALDLGLLPAIRWLAEDFRLRWEISCLVDADIEGVTLEDAEATAVFRVVQESLTNIARHAQATEVTIALRRDGDHLRLTVRDDGVGFDPAAAGRTRNFGLLGMRERILAFGGEARVESAPGAGTTVVIRLPLGARAENAAPQPGALG
jgi:signal transduction histidine kinase/PAS domain-containing protein